MAIINKLKGILKPNFCFDKLSKPAQQTGKDRCSWIVIN